MLTLSTDTAQTEINAVVSSRILAFMVTGGMTLQQAFDRVLGQSQYECLVDELYHALRGEAA